MDDNPADLDAGGNLPLVALSACGNGGSAIDRPFPDTCRYSVGDGVLVEYPGGRDAY
ncbi:hypothetical protein DOTSEDRAFT_39999 [Dothistroma septosporum NZE10]|uniref:Uncharacterized protein n=1 Tax=Dothistroma septosporum (strain NZE10 / CBS 128990) TaxID=675120 RepID=N1Q241_DOTSN|nr:hypothetical protein DOTSEDRAFT_39999 [Dothistroma septosporum NZE10]